LTFLQLIGCCIIFISILIAVYDKKRDWFLVLGDNDELI
jgi:hypothetical protein